MRSLKRPSLLLFDLGGVLYTLDYDRTWGRLQRSCGKSYDDIKGILYDDSFIRFEKGNLSPRRYFTGVCLRLGCKMSYKQFKETFNAFLIKREEMFGLLLSLSRTVHIHFLSNTNAINAELLKEDLSVFRAGSTLSFETGFRKPEPEIYTIALNRTGVSADDAVFIDDFDENVRAAEAMGIRSHLFKGKEGLLHFLEEEGIGPA